MSWEKDYLINLIHKPISGEWGDSVGNTNVLRTTNFTNSGKLDLTEVVKRNIDQSKIDKKRLEPGDTIIEKSGGSPSQPVGRVVYFNECDTEYVCNNFTSIIRANTKLNSRYLFWFLFLNHQSQNTLKYQNKTTGIINLQLERYVQELEIPIPPLETQKRIADILDAADALRQKDQELLKKYDELAQSIFIEMFGDPVINPKGWNMRIMANVCDKISVGFVGICEPYYTDIENGIPMIRTGNLGEGYLRFDKLKYVTKEFHLKQKKSQLFKDDILIARHGDNGKAVLFNGEFEDANCLNIIILRPAKGLLNGTYNVNMLNNESLRNYILGKTGGATQKVVNTKEIQKLIVPIPPIDLQNHFSDRVAAIVKQKGIEQKSLDKSEALFKNLLQKAFKGELI